MDTLTVQVLVTGLFVLGLGLLCIMVMRNRGDDNDDRLGNGNGPKTAEESTANKEQPRSLRNPISTGVLLLGVVILVWLVGLVLDRGVEILQPWRSTDTEAWFLSVLLSFATGALVWCTVVAGFIWVIYAAVKRGRDGVLPAGSSKVFLSVFLVGQVWLTFQSWQSLETTRVSADAQYYLDEAAKQLAREETIRIEKSGWLPFEPNPSEVYIAVSTPREVVEGLILERAYRYEKTLTTVLRFLPIDNVKDTENWDGIYFQEFLRNLACNDKDGLENLRLGGIAEFIALANNGDLIGRVRIALEDCLEDTHRFSNKVPMKRNGDVYYVNVALDESVSAFLVVDSGASDVSISPSLVDQLVESGAITPSDALEPQLYILADGSEVVMQRFMLDSMHIGNRELNDIVISVNASDDGLLLLGQSVLKKLGRYSIDYQRQILIF